MTITGTTCRLWAKTDELGEWHPLWCHLLDTLAVAEVVGETSLGPARRRLFAELVSPADEDLGLRWAVFLAAAHDVGKASPAFQAKAADHVTPLRGLGYTFANEVLTGVGASKDPTPHGVVSAVAIRDWLVRRGADELDADALAASSGGHHGWLTSFGDMRRARESTRRVGAGAWEDAREQLLALLADAAGVTVLDAAALLPSTPASAALSGFVSVIDWIASDRDSFPFEPHADADYLRVARTRARSAVARLRWTPLAAGRPCAFEALFPFEPRDLQRVVGDAFDESNGPALLIVEGPMGDGKTEAAFHVAHTAMARDGASGVYIGLPTRATANQMYRRLEEFVRGIDAVTPTQLLLTHGHAALEEGFRAVRRGSVYDDAGPGSVVADEWFTRPKRALLAPLGVGTVDQALLGVLRVRHGHVRLFGLAGKVVVFDEVHAYDAFTSEIIARAVGWIRALGGTAVLLSATLPSSTRQQLLHAWGCTAPPEAVPYPRVTFTRDGVAAVRPIAPTFASQRVRVERCETDTDTIVAELVRRTELDGCAVYVANTIDRAQRAFVAARALAPDIDLSLVHSRLPAAWRSRREARLIRQFGKDGPKSDQRPDRAIVIGTQVLEQSLDVDFDFMVTDLAPTDLVLQRAGRLHRHGRPLAPGAVGSAGAGPERPAGLLDPVLCIAMPPRDVADPEPSLGEVAGVYDRFVRLRSWLCLRDRESIDLPDEIEALVEQTYADLDVGERDGELGPALTDAWAEHRATVEAHANLARRTLVVDPGAEPDELMNEGQRLEEDDPTAHPSLRARTRLGDEGVTVALLHRVGEHEVPVAHPDRPLAAEPGGEDVARLVESSVVLRGRRDLREALRASTPWAKGVLRNMAALTLVDGEATVAGHRIRLDDALGVVVEGPDG